MPLKKRRELKETGEGDSGPVQKKKKRSRRVDPEVREGRQMQIALEAALQAVVPPIVEKSSYQSTYKILQPRSSFCSALVDENRPPRYKLKFMNGLDPKVFTRKVICDRYGEPLKICMAATHKEGAHLRILSAKIRVVVLDGDSNRHNQECWTWEEFSNSIVRPRDRIAALLTGDPELSLVNGEAYLCGFTFADNSKFVRSGKFRLGLMVIDELGERVHQECITEPFIVKDRRGEGSKKHGIPLLNDDIWCLNIISKDGASYNALKGSGIVSVKDFLTLYYKDEQALRKVLVRAKEFVSITIVEHAKKCDPGTELYSFSIEGNSVMVFFNSVCQMVGAKFGESYTRFSDLEKIKKDLVVQSRKVAYEKMTYDQPDYEMDNGKPRPINQEMFQRLSMVELEYTDPMPGHSAEANRDVCLPDGQHGTSSRLEYVGVAENDDSQRHLDDLEQEAAPLHLNEQHLVDLEQVSAWINEQPHLDALVQEAVQLQEQQLIDEVEQDATQLQGQQHHDELEQEAAQLQEQQNLEELAPVDARLQEQEDQDELEQKQQHLDELKQEVARLQAENARLAYRAADIDVQYARLEQENKVLRASAAELGHRLRSVDGMRHGFEGSSCDFEVPNVGAMPIETTTAHLLDH